MEGRCAASASSPPSLARHPRSALPEDQAGHGTTGRFTLRRGGGGGGVCADASEALRSDNVPKNLPRRSGPPRLAPQKPSRAWWGHRKTSRCSRAGGHVLENGSRRCPPHPLLKTFSWKSGVTVLNGPCPKSVVPTFSARIRTHPKSVTLPITQAPVAVMVMHGQQCSPPHHPTHTRVAGCLSLDAQILIYPGYTLSVS